MPNSIESLRIVEEGRRVVIFLVKGGGYGIDDMVALLDCGVLSPETYDGIESVEEELF
jgi:hypothetical protein